MNIQFDKYEEDGTGDKRIGGDTFIHLINDPTPFSKIVIIDCRSESEFKAGHIKNAIHWKSDENLKNIYEKEYSHEVAFIFHCEFSAIRAPATKRKFFQIHEETKNKQNPINLFILNGGFRLFYKTHRNYCLGKYVHQC